MNSSISNFDAHLFSLNTFFSQGAFRPYLALLLTGSLLVIAVERPGRLMYPFSLIFLARSGEMWSARDLAIRQQQGPRLYGTAINSNSYQYKLELYRARRPQVVVMGSSLVMQFRQWEFRVPFVNLGGAMNHLSEGEALLRDILKIHRPEVIILGLDPWWLNGASPEEPDMAYHKTKGNEVTERKLSSPGTWLHSGKLVWRDLMAGIFGPPAQDFGLNAILSRAGYGPDGSYYYIGALTGKTPHHDPKFSNTFDRIDKGQRRFEFGTNVSMERWASLERLLALARSNDIRVLVFLPPMSVSVSAKLAVLPDRYSYIDELRTRLFALPEPVFDFFDARSTGLDDCEFVDGIHGGDVAYARLLLSMAAANPNMLGALIDRKEIEKIVATYTGLAMVPNEFQRVDEVEGDAVGLGCLKENARIKSAVEAARRQ